MDTLQIPAASIISHHVFPYLDQRDVDNRCRYCQQEYTVQSIRWKIGFPRGRRRRMVYQWNSTKMVSIRYTAETMIVWIFSFDHTDDSRLMALNRCKRLGLLFDSRRELDTFGISICQDGMMIATFHTSIICCFILHHLVRLLTFNEDFIPKL